MPSSPNTSIATARPDLAATLSKFDAAANRRRFVGLRVMPILVVSAAFGQLPSVEIKDILQKNVEDRRTTDGTYNRLRGRFGKDSYACEEHGIEERVDDREAAMWGAWIDAEMAAAERCLNNVIEGHEARVIALANAISTTTAITTQWDAADATPVTDITTAKDVVRMRCGEIPNALVIEHKIFEALRNNAEIIDRLNSAGAGVRTDNSSMTEALIAQALGLDEVIVAGGLKNTANYSAAVSLSTLWTQDNAMLFVKKNTRDLTAPRWGNTFLWKETLPGTGDLVDSIDSEEQPLVEMYRDERARGDIVRVRWDTDEKVLFGECAQLLTGIAS